MSNPSSPIIDFVVAGYQKTATTWLYHCLAEHPQVSVANTHGVNYFEMHFDRGEDWYRSFFTDPSNARPANDKSKGDKIVGDVTPSYMRFGHARRRISQHSSDLQLIVILRNPIDRAFSHYWHEKKKRKINYSFDECLGNNADIFDDWIASSFYDEHLEDMINLIGRDRMLVLVHDDLKASSSKFCKSVFNFLGVDASFEPSVMNQKMNQAWFRPTLRQRMQNLLAGRPMNESEYDRGMDDQVRQRLANIFRPHVEQTSRIIDRDLTHWLETST